MKYIIIGLGNFGSALAKELTSTGHEVIGVDSDAQKVELFKESITSTICINCNDQNAVETLPLNSADVVVVCIGEDFGSSIMVTAILKSNKVKRLICRATSLLHETVLKSVGVNDIVFPEQETALRLSQRLHINSIKDSYKADERHFVIKSYLPAEYDGLSIEEIDFKSYNLILLAVLEERISENIFGESVKRHAVANNKMTGSTKLNKDDLIMVYGERKNISRFFLIE